MLALLILLAAPMLVPGSTSIWTDNGVMWAGNRMCMELKQLPAAGSQAADGGVKTPLHCPVAGPNSSGCIEWLGSAPSVGPCDPAPGAVPAKPGVLEIR